MNGSSTNRAGGFAFRGAQLDLARQVENLDYIKSYIDFIAANGFTHLVLYLEGRVRTESFHLFPENESYSPDQMRQVVAYAATKRIEVVPVVSPLSHTEHFLKFPELEGLSELRGGRRGRFSTFQHVTCPSLQATLDFFEAYMTEVAALFPSEYFHAGCDEAWDMGFCDLCRKRLETETQADLFAKFVVEIHRIVHGKLGKRMIIWDDMLEYYPAALPQLPRDIVMCCWHYGNLVDKPTAHFGNRLKIDSFALYDKLGFEYLVGTSHWSLSNVETFTAYAANYKPLGGLVTVWELSNAFLFISHPVLARAGRLWSGQGDPADKQSRSEAIAATTGIKDAALNSTLAAVLNWRFAPPTDPTAYRRGHLDEEERGRWLLVDAAVAALEAGAPENDVTEDILTTMKLESEYYALRGSFAVLLDAAATEAARGKADAAIQASRAQLRRLKAVRVEQWRKHRAGVTPCHVETYFDKLDEVISALAAELARPQGVLTVTFFLPECYSAQTTDFLLRYEGEAEWRKVGGGVFKQLPSLAAFYDYKFLTAPDKVPAALRIESHGYGGQGFAFLEIVNRKGRFVPGSIAAVAGKVENPENIFSEDQKWCFVGERDTRFQYVNPALGDVKHVLELNLLEQMK